MFRNGQKAQQHRLLLKLNKYILKSIYFEEVFIKKQGNVIVLIPIEGNPWETLLTSLNQFSDDFMTKRDQPSQKKREDIFK